MSLQSHSAVKDEYLTFFFFFNHINFYFERVQQDVQCDSGIYII